MKLFLDDIREPPDASWIVCRTVEDVFAYLDQPVTCISLDHDLGDSIPTGYDLVKYIEMLVAIDSTYDPPWLVIHSANPVGRANMLAGIASIQRLIAQRSL